MTNLTDKWKKGELPAGYYYIEAITGEKIIDFMPYNENEFKLFPSHTSIVICEVPSYEEWQAKLEENTKLKELLKEVLRHNLSLKEVSELTRKIAQVLGEE